MLDADLMMKYSGFFVLTIAGEFIFLFAVYWHMASYDSRMSCKAIEDVVWIREAGAQYV